MEEFSGKSPAKDNVRGSAQDELFELRLRYVRVGGTIRLVSGAITAIFVAYAALKGYVHVPLYVVAGLILLGGAAGFYQIPLVKRFPQHTFRLIHVFLLLDNLIFAYAIHLFKAPYSFYFVLYVSLTVVYAGMALYPSASLIYGILGGIGVTLLGILDKEAFLLPTMADPGGERFLAFSVLGTASYLIIIGVMAYVMTAVMVRQRRDLDEQREALRIANEELRRINQSLSAVSRYKSDFLSTMSHELRTPLNSILGFSEVILRGVEGPLTEGQEEDLRRIQRSGRYLLALVNDVLDMAKIEAGEISLTREPVDVAQVAAEALELLEQELGKAGLSVSMDAPPAGIAIVSGDRRRIQQIVFNLLSNAIKFTGTSGEINVRILPQDERVQVDVEDTGVGIPLHERERIFDSFKQGSRVGTTRPSGVGLGLSIARRLVEMHGGEIWVHVTGGRGATFSFTLPRTR